MFGFSKSLKNLHPASKDLYLAAMEQSRQPILYSEYGVPDTMIGRYDSLLLHLFLILNRLQDFEDTGDLSQDIFDFCFADMDQSLRESGVGDMGVSKRMKKMMIAFNGRMHAYQASLSGAEDMKQALMRNIYGDSDLNESDLNGLYDYMTRQQRNLVAMDYDQILKAQNIFTK